jgi:hypothetical protein
MRTCETTQEPYGFSHCQARQPCENLTQVQELFPAAGSVHRHETVTLRDLGGAAARTSGWPGVNDGTFGHRLSLYKRGSRLGPRSSWTFLAPLGVILRTPPGPNLGQNSRARHSHLFEQDHHGSVRGALWRTGCSLKQNAYAFGRVRVARSKRFSRRRDAQDGKFT